jgi:acetyl-CoA carboxylase carboxyltransferase component
MRSLRERIRRDLGGEKKVARIRADGRLTIRQHIDLLVDEGSFRELGTFVAEPREGMDFWAQPGDGIVGGLAAIQGRPVIVCGNDDTVRRGTNGPRGSKKYDRLYEAAERRGTPFVIIGQSSGARLPESIEPHHFAEKSNPVGTFTRLLVRERSIPVVTVIVGPSFGSSSFYAGLSDYVVQLEGTCLALTSPRVIEIATGEQVNMEDLGGTAVHANVTGQIDAPASSPEDAYRQVRAFLSYLPSAAGRPLPLGTGGSVSDDPEIEALVPTRRTRAYDVRKVIARLVDDGEYLELKAHFSTNMVTALGRIGGIPVGFVANQPQRGAGAITPDACRKATRLICLCDAYGLPIIYLADNPGFLVGTVAEQGRALAKAMQLARAGALARVPKCMVILRKAFGLGFTVMGGGDQVAADLALAWPGAEVGFMDPRVAANVLHAGRASELEPEERGAFLEEQVNNLARDFAPYGVASSMTIDEIIEPAATRRWLAEFVVSEAPVGGAETGGPLASWPFW